MGLATKTESWPGKRKKEKKKKQNKSLCLAFFSLPFFPPKTK